MNRFEWLRRVAIVAATGAVLAVSLGNEGCSHSDPLNLLPPEAGTSSISGPDAAAAVQDADVLKSYCPSSACPAPFTTCPGSQFLCQVNLADDPFNCGSCGFACPADPMLGGKYQCVEGKCILQCTSVTGRTADCDGIVDNGCEVSLDSNTNCGACGVKCEDPAKPCVVDTTGSAKCGCGTGLVACPGFPRCVDPKGSDNNCGACGKLCSPTLDGGALPPHAHYGCAGGECGHLKCDANYADCDGDLAPAGGNGCEASLLSPATCGACATACSPGQGCGVNYQNGSAIECMCGPGKKNCGTSEYPFCTDITTDAANCGGCGIWCGVYFVQGGFSLSHYTSQCTAGSCSLGCEQGWADCNGSLEDGCEVNVAFDPKNCGGCGKACDAVGDQACVAGQCALEPCGEQDGGTTR